MVLTSDGLKAIGALLDIKLQPINERIESLELHLSSTESTLKNQIKNLNQ